MEHTRRLSLQNDTFAASPLQVLTTGWITVFQNVEGSQKSGDLGRVAAYCRGNAVDALQTQPPDRGVPEGSTQDDVP